MKMGLAFIGVLAVIFAVLMGSGLIMTDNNIFVSDTQTSHQAVRQGKKFTKDMIGDIEKVLKPGMTKKEVVELLGTPDSENTPNYFQYDLGTTPVGREGYIVRFDDAGKVVSFRFVREDAFNN